MKLCIFDMGGVVCDETRVTPLIAKHLGISRGEFIALMGAERIRALQTGRITTECFWQEFSAVYGSEIQEDLWRKYFDPVRNLKTMAVIAELQQHLRVVVGTNTIDSHYTVHAEKGDYDIFQAIYASHLIGQVKPDADFYHYILQSEGCSPAEAIFIDDSLDNVRAAAQLGIVAIHFLNADNLREQLAGILPIISLR